MSEEAASPDPDPNPPPAPPERKGKGRFSLLVNGAYQPAGERACPILYPFTKEFHTNEMAWERPSVLLGPEWSSLKLGWIETHSFVIIINKGPGNILLGQMIGDVCRPFIIIPPGFPQIFAPLDIAEVRIKSAGGDCTYKAIILPG